MMRYFFGLLFLSLIPLKSVASTEDIETAGDYIQFLVPITGYAATYYLDDQEGRNQFYKAALSTFLVTHGLKHTVRRERPDGSDNLSFPSGHTAAAFLGAAFIHQRYGIEYGVPAYLAASFVGYSRVEAEKHYVTDVLAGATIGFLSNLYFTSKYEGVSVAYSLDSEAPRISFIFQY